MDRASDFESAGWGFESLRVRQLGREAPDRRPKTEDRKNQPVFGRRFPVTNELLFIQEFFLLGSGCASQGAERLTGDRSFDFIFAFTTLFSNLAQDRRRRTGKSPSGLAEHRDCFATTGEALPPDRLYFH